MDMRQLGPLRDLFRESPWAAQPFFINDRFQRAYRDLLAAARTHVPLLLLTGEAGVGKSTLLRYLREIESLLRGLPFGITVEIWPPAQAQPNTHAEKRAEALAANGAPTPDTSVANPADTWERFRTRILRHDTDTRPMLLLVDDAQEMPDPLLQELIFLPVESQRKVGTLTVVLVGRPDLVPRLVSLGLDPVHQLGASIELFALSDADVNAYVQQALAHAGCGHELFPPPTTQRIAAISEGNPRRINQLCRTALSAAVAGGAKIVTPDIIADAACQCSFSAVAADAEKANALQDQISVITNSAPDTIHPTGAAGPMLGSRQGTDERSFVNPTPRPQSRAQLSQADQAAPSALAGSAAATMSLAAVVPAQDASAEPTLAWIGRGAASIGRRPILLRFGVVTAGISTLAAGVVAWPLIQPYLVPSENRAERPAPSPSLVKPEPSPMPEPARGEPPATQPVTFARADSVAAVDRPALESEVVPVPAAMAPEGSPPTPSEDSESGNAGERPSTDLTMEQAPAADENARPRTTIGAPQTTPLTSPAAAYRPHLADASPSDEGKAMGFSAPATIEVALARGNDLMTQSDVVSARLLYGYAVTRGSVAAMTAMGRTYDAVFFTRSGTRGVRPESAKAIEWYERAIDGGDVEAKRHLRDLVLELRDASDLDPTQAAALLRKTE